MNAKELIEQWVKEKSSFSFFLPDGPYGRPFDNQYVINMIIEWNDGFEIVFSDAIILRFIGEPNVMSEGCNLTISNFTRCNFEIKNSIIKSYDSGEVTLNGF